jgi:adenosylmethionine-8-amino-7-oxononanoate aminotransferase
MPLATLPGVAEVRSAGLLGAIEIDGALLAEAPTLPDRIVLEARRRGVLTRALRGTSLQLSPAFVASDDEIRGMVAGLGEAVETVTSG